MKNSTGLLLRKPTIKLRLLLLLDDIVKEFSVLHVLGDKEQTFIRLDNFVELNERWMHNFLQY